jgi:hypothetical protein
LGIKETIVGTTHTYKRPTEASLKKIKGPLTHLLIVMARIGIKPDDVDMSSVSEVVEKIVALKNDNLIDPSDLSELVSSPLCLYFGLWCRLNDVWSVKRVGDDKEMENYKYWLPYWGISSVKNFKFFFTLAFQSLVNMMAINIGLMGADVRTEEHVYSMMSESLYTTQVLNWTKDDREVFFDGTHEANHFKILMVSTLTGEYLYYNALLILLVRSLKDIICF